MPRPAVESLLGSYLRDALNSEGSVEPALVRAPITDTNLADQQYRAIQRDDLFPIVPCLSATRKLAPQVSNFARVRMMRAWPTLTSVVHLAAYGNLFEIIAGHLVSEIHFKVPPVDRALLARLALRFARRSQLRHEGRRH